MTDSWQSELELIRIRPTRQRRALLALIRRGGARHLSAEQLFREAAEGGLRLSLATVYNTLNLDVQAGLLRRVDVGERTWFCSNRTQHHHMFDETTCTLTDLPGECVRMEAAPRLPAEVALVRTEVIVRVRRVKS